MELVSHSLSQENIGDLAIWAMSEGDVLVIGEQEYVLTKKSTVLKTFLADASRKYRQRFQAPDEAINQLSSRIEALEEKLSELQKEQEVIVLREVTREDAKDEIENLFKEDRVLYFSDVAKELRIDLEVVVEICEELLAEGKISIDE